MFCGESDRKRPAGRGELPDAPCQAPEDVEGCFIIDPQIELDARHPVTVIVSKQYLKYIF
jgi:hypothetical protein